jgi:hypothetical protein
VLSPGLECCPLSWSAVPWAGVLSPGLECCPHVLSSLGHHATATHVSMGERWWSQGRKTSWSCSPKGRATQQWPWVWFDGGGEVLSYGVGGTGSGTGESILRTFSPRANVLLGCSHDYQLKPALYVSSVHFSLPGSHPGCHITFRIHVALDSSYCESFLAFLGFHSLESFVEW